MNSPLVSIIVPVYNVEPYLRKCLDSILAQTFTDWEAILVDDGSTDRSGEICDEYAKRDIRVRVIHKENGGVSSARNFGIEKSRGAWFIFCDADDMLYNDALSKMVDCIGDNIDSVCGGYITIDETDAFLSRSYTKSYKITIGRDDALTDFYKHVYGDLFNGYLWNRLLKADIIHKYNLQFREDIYVKEDGLFLVQYFCCSNGKHAYFSAPVYKYRQNMSGAMKTYNKHYNKKSLSNLQARCYCYDVIKRITNNRILLNLAKECVAHKYTELLFNILKTREDTLKRIVRMSSFTFKYISPIFFIKWCVKTIIKKLSKLRVR